MALNNRTFRLLHNLAETLTSLVNEKIGEYNTKYETALPLIVETDTGFRDVVTGLRTYPALIVAETRRDASSAYFTEYDLSVCIALRNDDIDALQQEGSAILDCLEDVCRMNSTIGGNVLSVDSLSPEIGVVSNVFIASVQMTVTVDLGSFDGMGGEDA